MDPQKRWTAEQLLGHPWLTDERAGVEEMGLEVRLRVGMRRGAPVRLKALALAVVFLNRLAVRTRMGGSRGVLGQDAAAGGCTLTVRDA